MDNSKKRPRDIVPRKTIRAEFATKDNSVIAEICVNYDDTGTSIRDVLVKSFEQYASTLSVTYFSKSNYDH